MLTPSRVRHLLEPHGVCKPQKAAAWKCRITLPEALSAFYWQVGPVNITIENPANPFYLPRLSQLWNYQEGYRWDASTGDPDSEWDPDWIVVATQGADPFIHRTSDQKILFARHGTGTWEPSVLYPDICCMAAGMATLGTIVAGAAADLLDDDDEVRARFRKQAASALKSILGSPRRVNHVLRCAGWI